MADFISLHQLNTRIKEELADSFPQTMWIVAEISELRTHNSGHCYLELIEKDLQTRITSYNVCYTKLLRFLLIRGNNGRCCGFLIR